MLGVVEDAGGVGGAYCGVGELVFYVVSCDLGLEMLVVICAC